MQLVVAAIVSVGLVQPDSSQETRRPSRLSAHAERGIGKSSGDGWQHIVLSLENTDGPPTSGRATLYEWQSQEGARPRIELPFAVTDKQVLHLYPFRPPESPQPSTYLITLQDDHGQAIAFGGGSQFVIDGRSTHAIRVDMGSGFSGDYRVAIWGDTSLVLRNHVNTWTASGDELNRLPRTLEGTRRWMVRGSGWPSPEAISLEHARLLPDSFVGYGGLDVFTLLGVDVQRELTERQRRAIAEWVNSGGHLVVIPGKKEQITGPFWVDLLGIQDQGEVIARDERHLAQWVAPGAGPAHQPVHFLVSITPPPGAIEATVSYDGRPVVFSAPAGYGRVWIIAFDPDAHGGLGRYRRLWTEILNQTVRHRLSSIVAASLAENPWSFDDDQNYLRALREQFGNSPALEVVGGVILGYLIIVGPANFFLLKRRQARVWLLATVPTLAILFGMIILGMGYVTHGVRSAVDQMAIAIVTPRGDRAFVHEFIGVYGTTSAHYRLGFPRTLPVRPLGEFLPGAGGGFENPSNFQLVTREDRLWLENWRLTFWQTRGIAATDCVPLEGELRAIRDDGAIRLVNNTSHSFEAVFLLSKTRAQLGTLGPHDAPVVSLPEQQLSDWDRSDHPFGSTARAVARDARGVAGAPASPPSSSLLSGPVETKSRNGEQRPPAWPEADFLLGTVSRRLYSPDTDWILALTRQPVHRIDTPDTGRHIVTTLFAWPVTPEP